MDKAAMPERDYQIYAVDFDGTLCEDCYPGIGRPNKELIAQMRKEKEQGDKIILWTCRCGDKLREAVKWCREQGLEFDAVNANLPEMVDQYESDSRKVFADVYVDDKAADGLAYCVPYKGIPEA